MRHCIAVPMNLLMSDPPRFANRVTGISATWSWRWCTCLRSGRETCGHERRLMVHDAHCEHHGAVHKVQAAVFITRARLTHSTFTHSLQQQQQQPTRISIRQLLQLFVDRHSSQEAPTNPSIGMCSREREVETQRGYKRGRELGTKAALMSLIIEPYLASRPSGLSFGFHTQHSHTRKNLACSPFFHCHLLQLLPISILPIMVCAVRLLVVTTRGVMMLVVSFCLFVSFPHCLANVFDTPRDIPLRGL
jgi:hypothetical protein